MNNRKILIVDDSLIVRGRLVARLKNINDMWTILQADTVSSALSIIQSEELSFVVLDIQLPDGSGLDIIAKIKKHKPATVVIMLTNYPYSILRKRSIELGANYFFDKSTEFEKVFDIISNRN